MDVSLSPSLEAKLDRLAIERGCDKQALVQDAIEALVNSEEWFRQEVVEGLAAADRGEFVEHDGVKRLIDNRYPG
jgi:predicted transcriptional regulator